MKNPKQILLIIFVIALTIFTVPFGVVNAAEIPTADVTVSTWSDLQDEIDSATSSKVIKLGSNIVAPNPATDSDIDVLAGKNITINLNGYIIDRGIISSGTTSVTGDKGSVIKVHGILTIVDGNPNVEHRGTLSENGYFWTWDGGSDTGDTIIKGGIITGGSRTGSYNGGSGIRVYNDTSSFIMKGGTIAGNRSLNKAHAGGVYVNYGSFNMTGGEIKYNSAVQHGGGVFIRYGTFTMGGTAKITKNTVSSNGGGLYLMSNTNSSFIMNGGEISYNNAKMGGGIRGEKVVTINGGLITNNKASSDGGGIASTVIMTGGEITSNTSSGRGGGVYGSITMTGGKITSNTSTGNGGGLYGTNITLGGTAQINGNVKGTAANNVYLDNDKVITISNNSVPTSDMNIGITTAVAPIIGTPVAITSNGGSGIENYFNSDNINYYVLNQDNILKLVKDGNPTGKIKFQEKSFTSFLNSITFGLFFNEKFDVVITASDDIGVKSIEYYISDKQLTENEVKAITDWKTYSKFAIESDSKYVIYAKITDSIDNVTYISSDGFVLDMIAPIIKGLDYNNGVYYTTQRFDVEDSYIDKVLINNVEVTDYVLPGNVDETYEIDVFDKAGNSTYLSIRMMPVSSIGMLLNNYTVENVVLENKEDIEYIKDKASNIDKTYATDTEKEELQEIIDKCDSLLEAIENKYIAEVDITLSVPKVLETVENNTFEVTSKYDNIVISVKEWRLNGSSDALPSDYVFEENTIYIPILKIERKNETHYFNENTTLTVHGSNWSNGENTYKLKDHKDYGYVKDLSDGSFIIDQMSIITGFTPKYEVILGANQTYTINKNKEALFKIDAQYSLFDGRVYVDDILLDQNDYTSVEEMTIIKLKKDFVDSLKVGKHTLKVGFSDGGEATTNFIIDVLNEDNPKTGDNIVSYLLIGSLSLIGLIGCSLYLNRKRFN